MDVTYLMSAIWERQKWKYLAQFLILKKSGWMGHFNFRSDLVEAVE